tara:strand:- start:19 stop:276 length:258 start_codon:yes stop_codon:yes gene_type:complete
MIKILLLKNKTVLITEIEEVTAELGEPDCKLINPVEILDTEPLQLKKWLNDYTTQTTSMLSSDSILTIVDPHKIIEDDYKKFLSK